jgi:F-type H+-transporting ATPase subunit alpha
MEIKNTDLVSLFEQALQGNPGAGLEEIGIVVQVGDGICKVHGLTHAMYGELIDFEGGNQGIIMQLDEESVSLFLLHSTIPVVEREVGRRTGSVFKIPVGTQLLGRVINAMGRPIDGLGDIAIEAHLPIEADIPGIIERSPVNESLETGILAIDALIPIGKGQRELLIGNRSTGKTAIALDIILHQKNKNVICIYVSIGQRVANLARITRALQESGALDYTVVISAESGESALSQYLAPYGGCTIGEYFRSLGKDVFIVYDDL